MSIYSNFFSLFEFIDGDSNFTTKFFRISAKQQQKR